MRKKKTEETNNRQRCKWVVTLQYWGAGKGREIELVVAGGEVGENGEINNHDRNSPTRSYDPSVHV